MGDPARRAAGGTGSGWQPSAIAGLRTRSAAVASTKRAASGLALPASGNAPSQPRPRGQAAVVRQSCGHSILASRNFRLLEGLARGIVAVRCRKKRRRSLTAPPRSAFRLDAPRHERRSAILAVVHRRAGNHATHRWPAHIRRAERARPSRLANRKGPPPSSELSCRRTSARASSPPGGATSGSPASARRSRAPSVVLAAGRRPAARAASRLGGPVPQWPRGSS